MKSLVLPLLLALTAPCLGQTIKLPETVSAAVGQPVTINAETDGEIVRWSVVDAGLSMFDPDLQKTTKAAQVFSIKAGKYRVWAWTAKGDVPSPKAECLVVVGQPGPDPPDPPDPDPDNLTDTSKKVRDWAKAVGNKVETTKISNNYLAITAAIGAGVYDGMSFTDARAKIVADILALNKPVSSENEEWGKFFRNLLALTQELDAAGKLGSVAEIKAFFQEISKGLEAAQ